MNQSWLLDHLEEYTPFDNDERSMVKTTIDFVRICPSCFSRLNSKGHIVASAWVVNHDRSHVLLTHHRKLDLWLQLGGHVEDDIDLLTAACREAKEESGLQEVTPLFLDVFDVDVHMIPARYLEPEHTHYDIRFLFSADSTSPIRVSDESKALKWMPIGDVAQINSPSFKRLFIKTTRFFA